MAIIHEAPNLNVISDFFRCIGLGVSGAMLEESGEAPLARNPNQLRERDV